MDRKKDLRIPPPQPVWNIWQGLYIIALATLIEFPLGWLATPKDLNTLRGIFNFVVVRFGDASLYFILIGIFMHLIHRPFSDLGFIKPLFRYVVLGFVVGVLLFASIGFLGSQLTQLLGIPAPQSFAVAVNGVTNPWGFFLLVLLGGVVAPIKEEMLFRSILYPPLRRAFGKGKGIILTGVLFAVLHFDIVHFLPLFIGGVVLAWLYQRSSSIWPAIIANGTWNILMALALWIQRP